MRYVGGDLHSTGTICTVIRQTSQDGYFNVTMTSGTNPFHGSAYG